MEGNKDKKPGKESEKKSKDLEKPPKDTEKTTKDLSKPAKETDKSSKDLEKPEKKTKDLEKPPKEMEKTTKDLEKPSKETEKMTKDLAKPAKDADKSGKDTEKPTKNSDKDNPKLQKPERKTTLKLRVSCTDLKDPKTPNSEKLCVVSEQKKEGHWIELGRTEPIENNLSPKWKTPIIIEYKFEERQHLKFEIFNNNNDILATMSCLVSKVVSATGRKYEGKSDKGSGSGDFLITSEEIKDKKKAIELEFSGRNLIRKGKERDIPIYFVLWKKSADGRLEVVAKSRMAEYHSFEVSFEAMTVSVWNLCYGDPSRRIDVEVFQGDGSGKHHGLLGKFNFSISEMTDNIIQNRPFEVYDEGKRSGEIFIKEFSIKPDNTFLDYIQGGTELTFSVAIDFTASNGKVNESRSLHFCKKGGENQYTTAIRAVGEIIQDYGKNPNFPALGFGAKVPPNDKLSHDFSLNLMEGGDSCCVGVEGILEAYHVALKKVHLLGPTNFSPVINRVAQIARETQDTGSHYHTLVIITDGIVTDMGETKDAICRAADLAVSIIIVGVGDIDFADMVVFDGDTVRLKGTDGVEASRDIVQFVEMRRFVDGEGRWDKEALAKEVLAELPGQLEEWASRKGIKPFVLKKE